MAQKKTYIAPTAGIVDFSAEVRPQLLFSFGARPKNFLLGAGAGITQYLTKAYVPLYFETGYINRKKTWPFGIARVGYGVYSRQIDNTSQRTKGGLYLNLNVGISIPNKGNSLFAFGAGYVHSEFKVGVNSINTGSGYGLNGFTVFVSIIL
ncbi:MAG: hypothetical protein QM726_22820 [Chitinophagaceae bacterium]